MKYNKIHMTIGDDIVLPIAQIVPCTEAEGPGRRFALWFQGCPLRCPGCCNPEMLPFAGGQPLSVSEAFEQIRQTHERHSLEGITFLGGEPLAHAAGAAALAKQVRSKLALTVMIFTGYTLADARQMPGAAALLAQTDILVDGPYLREQPETRRRWIGSANQQVHFLGDRCQADDPRWLLPNTLEIRLNDGELSVNGFPTPTLLRSVAKHQSP